MAVATDVISAPRPSTRALRAARLASNRVKNRDLVLRRLFIRPRAEHAVGPDGSRRIAPMALCLRSGALRLRVYLCLLWMSSGGGGKFPHSTNFPAQFWAEMLDLMPSADEQKSMTAEQIAVAEENGRRRIADALRWLGREGLVRLKYMDPGHPPTVVVRRDDGSKAKYQRPPGDFFIVPVNLFYNGWVATLSGPALALLLILIEYGRPWLAGSVKERYGLSPDSWTKGGRELERFGIIARERAAVSRNPFESRRRRWAYSLNLERLDTTPE